MQGVEAGPAHRMRQRIRDPGLLRDQLQVHPTGMADLVLPGGRHGQTPQTSTTLAHGFGAPTLYVISA
jgi:hypothetical protein